MELPTEIYAEIFSYLDDPRIARVCRAFRSIVYSTQQVTIDTIVTATGYPVSFCHLLDLASPTQSQLADLLDRVAKSKHPERIHHVLSLMDNPNLLLYSDNVYPKAAYLEMLKSPCIEFRKLCSRAHNIADAYCNEDILHACVNDPRYDPEEHGWFCISYFIEYGHYRYAQMLVNSGKIPPEGTVHNIITACMDNNRYRMLDLLMSNGIKTQVYRAEKIRATKHGYINIIKCLDAHNLCTQKDFETMIYTAVEYNRLEMVEIIASRVDIQVRSAVFTNAIMDSLEDIALFLLECGVTITEQDRTYAANSGLDTLVQRISE